MCTRVVFDASAFSVLKQEWPESPGGQLRRWIRDGHGLIAFSTYGRVGRELKRDLAVLELFRGYSQSGRAVRVEAEQIRREEERLRDIETRSGKKDKPMLALAAASDARVMVTADERLRQDFEDVTFKAEAPGHPRRAAFPVKLPSPQRNDFLHRRRCSRRT